MKFLRYCSYTALGVLVAQGLSSETLHVEPVEAPDGGPQYVVYGDIDLWNTGGIFGDLFLDLKFGDGTGYHITTIPVDGDGNYAVFEFVDIANLPNAGATLELSSDSGLLPENLGFIDLALMGADAGDMDLTGMASGGRAGGGILDPYQNAIFIGSQTTNLGIQGFSSGLNVDDASTDTAPKTILNIQAMGSGNSTEQITYDANGMIIGVGASELTLDNEGNILSFTQNLTSVDFEDSRKQELADVFGWKTLTDWQQFDWTSSPTQGALDYLLAVQKGEITGAIEITDTDALTIRQGVLERFSYVGRSFVNGRLSAEGLDFSEIDLQFEDWRPFLFDMTAEQVLDAARSITNVSGQYAGIQGAYLPNVTFTGSENFSQISLAYVYTGSLNGITLAQVVASSKTKGGSVGTVFTPDQYNAWIPSLIANTVTICYVAGWDGVSGSWYQLLDQLWALNSGTVQAGGNTQVNPNQFIECIY